MGVEVWESRREGWMGRMRGKEGKEGGKGEVDDVQRVVRRGKWGCRNDLKELK